MKYMKFLILFLQSIIKSIFTFIRGHYRFAQVQNNNPTCKIYSTSNITNTILKSWVVIFDKVILYNCEIGNHTYIQKNSRIFNASIGNFCSIASNVSIAPGLHLTTGVSLHPSFYLEDTPLAITFAKRDYFTVTKKVTIENDVWIGENVIILDGITIHTGAIVAAGSVVTKDVQPYSVVGGLPARHIKFRFDEETIKLLVKSHWWNYPAKWFEKNSEVMLDIENFKAYI